MRGKRINQLITIVVLLASALMVGCATTYEYDPEVSLSGPTGPIDNQTVARAACGTGSLVFDYDIKANDTLGTLELENQGSCPITVAVTRIAAPAVPGTAVKKPKKGKLPNLDIDPPNPNAPTSVPVINIFNIPDPKKGGKLRISINCGASTGTEGCVFYYRLSTASENKNPSNAGVYVGMNNTGSTTATSPNANPCDTEAEDGKNIIKTFINQSKEDHVLVYEAVNSCDCENFIVYAVKRNSKNVSAIAPENGSDWGIARIPKGKKVEVELKAACKGQIEPGTCTGTVRNYRLTTAGNAKKKGQVLLQGAKPKKKGKLESTMVPQK